MNQSILLPMLKVIWAVFGIYWLVVARGGEVAEAGERSFYRPLRLMVLVVTFTLLFSERMAIGFLGRRFVQQMAPISYVGFAVTLAGLAVAVWARIHLGQYWSDKIVLKVDHQLIRSGPYAYLRHPIYSGVLLGVAGTILVIGEWRAATAFMLLLTNYWIKAKREEQMLASRFGECLRSYQKQAGFLLPRFRSKT
jgi:protein-S-isoprenylcysteine O-methyltransferase Ste14